MLKRREFDFAGIKETQSGPVVGWVSTKSLTSGRVKDHLRVIEADQLISDATPLSAVMNALRSRPLQLCLGRDQSEGYRN